MTNPNKVLIAMPCGSGFVPSMMVQSLLELRKPCPCAFLIVDRQQTHKARNYIAESAIAGGFTHVLMIDDDNPIPPDTLEKLLEDDKDIVIAPILTRNPGPDGKHHLCAFYGKKIETSVGEIDLYTNITKFSDEGPLHKIDAGGTGCMLIKTEVLKSIRDSVQGRFFENSFITFDKIEVNGTEYTSRSMSEDVDFCEKAVKAGFEIWLDERVRPIHIGPSKLVKYVDI